jgi:hypothetical protein
MEGDYGRMRSRMRSKESELKGDQKTEKASPLED